MIGSRLIKPKLGSVEIWTKGKKNQRGEGKKKSRNLRPLSRVESGTRELQ